MDNQLFDTFEPVSAKAWKQLIQSDLKGADYNETLVWESLEGIKVKPIYHTDEVEYLNVPKKKNRFKNAEFIKLFDEQEINSFIKDALKNGVEVMIVKADKSFDIDVLLQGVSFDKHHQIIFQLDFISRDIIEMIIEKMKTNSFNIWLDPIGHLFKTGSWYNSETDIVEALDIIKSNDNIEAYINASIFQNAGANIVQQIAYTLSYMTEYFNRDHKISLTKIPVLFAVGGNYFFEIAKFRAFRYLWEELKQSNDLDVSIELFAIPSYRNKTLKDFNNNILRSGTELMSAVLGGADVCIGLPYDVLFKEKNEASSRTARNQLNILKEEVSIEDVDKITQGTYYIEQISIELAKKALELFKLIEANEGLLDLFYRGKLQEKIKQSADKEQVLYDEGKVVLVGSNKYEQKEVEVPQALVNKRYEKTDYESIPVRYLAL